MARKRAAPGGRVLVTGISVSATFGIVAALAANRPSWSVQTIADEPSATTSTEPPTTTASPPTTTAAPPRTTIVTRVVPRTVIVDETGTPTTAAPAPPPPTTKPRCSGSKC